MPAKILVSTAVLGALVVFLAANVGEFKAYATMSDANEQKLRSIVSDDHREPNNAVRDEYRHPVEVLKFFQLRDDMSAMEIWPAGGWWTEILAPYLTENGKYVAAHFPDQGDSSYYSRSLNSFKNKISDDPENYGAVTLTSLMPSAGIDEPVQKGSMDIVLTFRNLHNWMASGSEREMIQIAHNSLKRGGLLGVVEHRAASGTPQDPKAKSGYVREDFAIDLIESLGFKLIAKSEINANAKDTKDYPGGVWTLPPSYREGDVNRDKYAEIGESDRFTLLFQKQ